MVGIDSYSVVLYCGDDFYYFVGFVSGLVVVLSWEIEEAEC